MATRNSTRESWVRLSMPTGQRSQRSKGKYPAKLMAASTQAVRQ